MLAWEEAGPSSGMLSKMSSRGQRKAPGPDQPQAPRKANSPQRSKEPPPYCLRHVLRVQFISAPSAPIPPIVPRRWSGTCREVIWGGRIGVPFAVPPPPAMRRLGAIGTGLSIVGMLRYRRLLVSWAAFGYPHRIRAAGGGAPLSGHRPSVYSGLW